MTLATRCAACGTAFRVVQDQLKIANGWVRCGRCAHVFDASDALFTPDASGAFANQDRKPVIASADTADVPAPNAGEVTSDDAAAPAVSEATDATPAALQPPDTLLASDGPALDDQPSPSFPPTPDLPPEAAVEPPAEPLPEPPRWLLATPVTEQPAVDVGIGPVATPTAPAIADDVPLDDDDREPDFVDARFNEDLLAGLPGLRDPDHDDVAEVDGGTAPHAADSAGATPVARAPSDLLQMVAASDQKRDDGSDHAPDQDTDHALVTAPPAAPAAHPDHAHASGSSVDTDASPSTADTALADDVTPAFLQQGRSDGRRWQRGPVRAALLACGALLLLTLGLQAALHWRDWLAARWPATAPWLVTACAPIGCRVQPLRRIDDLGVDSTSLAPASADSAALRLSVVLANRGDLPLAAPNVELALTDATGELVARKVLTPSDFHSTVDVLKPGVSLRWQTVLLASGEHVAGYTVELFYP